MKEEAERTQAEQEKEVSRWKNQAQEYEHLVQQTHTQEARLRAELKYKQQEVDQWEKEMSVAKVKVTSMGDHLGKLADNEVRLQVR